MIHAADPRFEGFLDELEADIKADQEKRRAAARHAKALRESRRGDQRHVPVIEHWLRQPWFAKRAH